MQSLFSYAGQAVVLTNLENFTIPFIVPKGAALALGFQIVMAQGESHATIVKVAKQILAVGAPRNPFIQNLARTEEGMLKLQIAGKESEVTNDGLSLLSDFKEMFYMFTVLVVVYPLQFQTSTTAFMLVEQALERCVAAINSQNEE